MADDAITPNVSSYDYHMVNPENAQNNSREKRVRASAMPSELRLVSRSEWITVCVLCFINLINYMDRFTIAGLYYSLKIYGKLVSGTPWNWLPDTINKSSIKIYCTPVIGMLTNIKTDFKLRNDESGLLQTAFILSYMVFAPLFGYLGDRYNRKIIMSSGVFLWCLTTFIGSYMKVQILI